MRSFTLAFIGITLLGIAVGCVDRTHTATIAGKVGFGIDRVESIGFSHPDAVAGAGFASLPDADISIVAHRPNGDVVLVSTKSDVDGAFTLDFPRTNPGGASLVVSAPGYEPYRYPLTDHAAGYQLIGIVLKRLDRKV